jgi:GTP pyrophosphokinase
MVSVTSYFPPSEAVSGAAVERWLRALDTGRDPRGMAVLKEAATLVLEQVPPQAGRLGESGLSDLFAVAEILAELGLRCDAMAASLLHGAQSHVELDTADWVERFGDTVVRIVQNLERMGAAESLSSLSEASATEHAENLRKMLLSIADDVRVVVIVLAERLHQMRVLKHLPEALRRPVAKETLDLYAPLANRLGIWQVKWELEDLCLRYLEPDAYRRIARALDGKRQEREHYVAETIKLLGQTCREAGIRAEITGRPKHIYSIWGKMCRKSVDIDQIFDLLAVRVLVDTVADCYAVLGIVHGLWPYLPGEFDDYIATPKANMYRSLHTAVIGPQNKPLEVQIRTHSMHRHAELGVAAHWRYKESRGQDAELERRILGMRRWLEQGADTDASPTPAELGPTLERSRIYVVSPKGKVVELPEGATAVDFAYAIHSSVGHRCRGARADGRIVPLNQPLSSGQTVEILTSKEGGPSRDWLNTHLGYARSTKARNRIRQWFKQQDSEQHVATGRASLDRELTRVGLPRPDLEPLARRFNLRKPDDLLAAIGRGDISPVQVVNTLTPPKPPRRSAKSGARRLHGGHVQVRVEGVDDLMTHMAKCCKPVPHDPIIGYITRGRGVTVHRRDCPVVHKMSDSDRSRLVRVVWSDAPQEVGYTVDLQILAVDRKGLLRDISSVLTGEDLDVLGVRSQSNRNNDTAVLRFTLEISGKDQLGKIIDQVSRLPDVMEVKRAV